MFIKNGTWEFDLTSELISRECITVVIPTMLLGPKDIFEYTLNQLGQCELVKNIIIIDNTETKEFDKEFAITNKIKHLKSPGNQGATYNPGMELCDTDYYLLLNDDVACRSNILYNCFKIMELYKDIGLIQINTKIMEPLEEYIKSEPDSDQIKIFFPNNPRMCMTGWFQFGREEDWEPIPKELKYFYGDDLLLVHMMRKNRKVARIISDYVSHMESSTVNQMIPVPELLREEGIIFNKIVKELIG